ncbi:MAG: Mercuric transport protein periplasmic component precursor [Chloroflexi bacterium ADurb.Bin120]|jgi:copper chaperone CopZ|uniref:Heavy metal binding protein n=1 Tax=Candidatus Brevifilum fermentans TaxID=1986204 RepID=A0A1Y6K5K4_9CHLR|nr:heavy-metal-associated domain-containing protein [Brevefilum fermentans]MDI9566523.1 heavy-metal-associated domain-containing protein [Chloroflexota bacterium]OQB82802.1 MAG: Mercuric transport protein periplasmic component precursor [Chloroflexi bacterium ADurb.Bin120]SMX54961.1 Heavy metal binding protein [Brevefilum fermentans]HOM67483.1 heavy-metal-associated domain-containing protein [Brevefilum fermentans]
MKSVTYLAPNISCKHCTHTIAMELMAIEGVSKVDADVQTRLVTITFDDPATEQQLKATLAEINYPVAE